MQSTYMGNISDLLEFAESDAMVNVHQCAPDDFVKEYKLAARCLGNTWITMLPKLDMAFFNRIVGLGIREPATEPYWTKPLPYCTMRDARISCFN